MQYKAILYQCVMLLLILYVPVTEAQESCDQFSPDCLFVGQELGTGIDHANNNANFPYGTQDSYWELIDAPGGIPLGNAWVIPNDPSWLPPLSNGEWISASASPIGMPLNPTTLQKPYTFERCFCICEGPAQLELMLMAAHQISEIRLDGIPIYSNNTDWNFATNPINIFEVVNTPGTHCLQVDVRTNEELPDGFNIGFYATGILSTINGNNGVLHPDCCEVDEPDPGDCASLPDSCRTDTLYVDSGKNHQTGSLYFASNPATTQDPYWKLIGGPSNPYVNLGGPAWVITPYPGWDTTSTTATWLSPYKDNNASTHAKDSIYTIQRCFCVCDTTTVNLNFTVFADDRVDEISIGSYLTITPSYTSGSHSHFLHGIPVNQSVTLPPGEHCINIDFSDRVGNRFGVKVAGFITGAHLENSNCCAPGSSITGFKYHDLAGDNFINANDPPLAGWTIQAVGQNTGYSPPPVTTDANGYYSFNNLPDDTYIISEVLPLPLGWSQTFPVDAGGNPIPYTITTSGSNIYQADFANANTVATICGTKFNDLDCNGIWSETEPSIPGWTIELLLNGDPNNVLTATTDANGEYCFSPLPPGTHIVREDAQGWTQTFPSFGDYTIPLGANQVVENIDFGNCETTPPDTTNCCTPAHDSLIVFEENFNDGPNHVSVYQQASTLLPGQYDYLNSTQAATVSNNQWNVAGSNNCDPGEGFLAVNGRTGGTGEELIYQSPNIPAGAIFNFPVVTPRTFDYCIQFKHLPQCAFDVVPNVRVDIVAFSTQIGNSGWVPIAQIPLTPVITTTGTCDYMTLSGTFTSPLLTNNVRIRIYLDETPLGDGNDLAIDNIIVVERGKVSSNDTDWGFNSTGPHPNDPNMRLFDVSAINPNLDMTRCSVSWEIQSWDTPGGNLLSSVTGTPPLWDAINTDFPGYPGTPAITPSGFFEVDVWYRIIRTVDCDCRLPNSIPYWIRVGSGESEPEIYNDDEWPIDPLQGDPENESFGVSTPEGQSEHEIKVYPNPFTSNVLIEFATMTEEKVSLTLLDASAKVVKQIHLASGLFHYSLETQGLPSGIYLLKVNIGNDTYTQTIVKQAH